MLHPFSNAPISSLGSKRGRGVAIATSIAALPGAKRQLAGSSICTAEVFIAKPQPKIYSYQLPCIAAVGMRVEVPLRQKLALGIIIKINHKQPERSLKAVTKVLEGPPLLNAPQLQLLQWMAAYYMTPLTQVIHKALRSNKLLEERAVLKDEVMAVKLVHPPFINSLQHKPKPTAQQRAIIAAYTTLAQRYAHAKGWVPYSQLREAISSISSLRRLIAKGVLESEMRPFMPLPLRQDDFFEADAATAGWLGRIGEVHRQKQVALWPHPLTAPLLKVVQQHIIHNWEKPGQLLILFPSPHSLKQCLSYFTPFRDYVATYLPQQSSKQQQRSWLRTCWGSAKIILGCQQAVLLPFQQLQQVVVLEEGSEGYRQLGSQPYHHARDVAIVAAKQHGAKVLLTASTCSLESYHNSQQGKYISLETAPLPQPKLELTIYNAKRKVDVRQVLPFGTKLLARLTTLFEEKKRGVMLLARGSYAAWVCCRDCSWVAGCPRCAATLRYTNKELVPLCCYRCSYASHMPARCPKCQGTSIHYKGLGLTQSHELLQLLFPQAKIETVTTTHYQQQLHRLAQGEIQLLLGTQQLIPALPFIAIDLLIFPDLATWLRRPTFASAAQTAWAMRMAATPFDVTLPTPQLLVQATPYDYPMVRDRLAATFDPKPEELYGTQLQERKKYGYPPYTRLISLTFLHRKRAVLERIVMRVMAKFGEDYDLTTLGPHHFLPPMLQQRHQKHGLSYWLKLPVGAHFALKAALCAYFATHARGVEVAWQVDPT